MFIEKWRTRAQICSRRGWFACALATLLAALLVPTIWYANPCPAGEAPVYDDPITEDDYPPTYVCVRWESTWPTDTYDPNQDPGDDEYGTESTINITERGFAHVLERHVLGGPRTAGKSIFHGSAQEVRGLIEAAGRVTPSQQAGGNFARVVDAGRTIGLDRATGVTTSRYTVIANSAGDLVTAFPGVP